MKALKFTWVPNSPANLKPIFDRCLVSIESTEMKKITLVVPGMSKPSAAKRRLAGVKSPLGEIVSDSDGNSQIVCFDAMEVLAWLVANKCCTMQEVATS